jgi:hypothetical protein
MTDARRGQLVISAFALVVGVGGLVVARDTSLTEARGEILFGLGVSFNILGALLTIGLAAVAVTGAAIGNGFFVLVGATGFGLAALQVLVQFGRADNWLGSRGSNLSFCLAVAVGLAALVWLENRQSKRP